VHHVVCRKDQKRGGKEIQGRTGGQEGGTDEVRKGTGLTDKTALRSHIGGNKKKENSSLGTN